jgi:DNA-directed RNA polymerase subunit RPC12/RpoP
MKPTPSTTRGGHRGLIRSLNRRGSAAKKTAPITKARKIKDPSICDRCGAIYTAKSWRAARRLAPELLAKAAYIRCPACEQVDKKEYFGRVLISGAFAANNLEKIRTRIGNVARRAQSNQPERRVVSVDWDGSMLEVLTTSQKLAHRIAHELEKEFGGHATYQWSPDDGMLLTIWKSPNPPGVPRRTLRSW